MACSSNASTSHRETEIEIGSNRPFASASAVAYPGNNYYYQVFINHRGPDVKKTFASFLYYRLISHGLKVFLDQPEMQEGENITSQIEGAIRSASVHVAIFSPRYAESKWCLDELVLMMESGRSVIPVFYEVKPSELRRTRSENGLYAKALHELQYDSDTIEKWRNVLSRVARISGYELEAYNGNVAELLEKVVHGVLKKVERTGFKVAQYPYGVEEKARDFEEKVLSQQRSGKPQLVGIVGLGGVGKTTLAKELFNRKSSHYKHSCFLSNARQTSSNFLKKNLFESLTRSDPGTDNIDIAIESLKNSNFKTLIILDDVDTVNQVEAVLVFQTGLSSDSLILITSRDRDVLIRSGVQNTSIYKLSGLNTQHARELFCSHAFGRPYPLPGFESLVDKYLKRCDGLPLSLRVLGANLFEQNDSRYWEHYLETIPIEIQEILKISYDGLDQVEKDIFLDIASFFVGEKMDMALRIWDGSGWNGWLAFQNLHNKSLVEVDNENKIKMHDHIRDMGREEASNMGREASGLPLRLWRWNIDDLYKLDNDQVRGIRTAPDHAESWYKSSLPDLFWKLRKRPHNRKLQILDVEDGDLVHILRRLHLLNLGWLRWRNCSYPSLPAWVPKENLRVLEVNSNVLKKLWQGKSQAPVQLRELVITSPLSKLPKSTGQLKELELIIINSSEIKSLPDSFGCLTKLKHIDLSGSKNLVGLPNSFGDLIRLKYLDLSHCNNLTISSKALGNISTLEYINLSYCRKIEVLPLQVANQQSLEKLNCPFLEIVPSPLCGNSKELKLRNGSSCKQLKCLPIPVEVLTQLTKLTVNECVFRARSSEKDEEETGTSTLKQSRGENSLSNLSSSIDLSKLVQLQHIELYKTEISEVSFPQGFCPNLQYLFIKSCDHLVKVGTLPNSLIELELSNCSNLKKIEGLCGLDKLQMLNIKWCRDLEELSTLENLVSLEVLDACGSGKLKRIEGLPQRTNLRRLDIVGCCELEELPGVEDLKSLKWLDADGCSRLQWGEGVVEKLQRSLPHLIVDEKHTSSQNFE